MARRRRVRGATRREWKRRVAVVASSIHLIIMLISFIFLLLVAGVKLTGTGKRREDGRRRAMIDTIRYRLNGLFNNKIVCFNVIT